MNPRILLVEDDPTTLTFLATAAEGLPATVDAVSRCSAARIRAASQPYALWLIDAHLPDGDGIGLLASLRATGLRTPAIAHTAAREPALRDALLAAGFESVLCKPLTASQLQAALRAALAARPQPLRDERDAAPASTGAVWDDDGALSALNGQHGHVEALRALFLAELPSSRKAVDDAVRHGNPDSLRAALHRLRASCGFVGAARLSAAVVALQQAEDPAPLLPEFLAATAATLSSERIAAHA